VELAVDNTDVSFMECEHSSASFLHSVHGAYWFGNGAGRRIRRSLIGEDMACGLAFELSRCLALARACVQIFLPVTSGARLLWLTSILRVEAIICKHAGCYFCGTNLIKEIDVSRGPVTGRCMQG